jgi:hypothetical protein
MPSGLFGGGGGRGFSRTTGGDLRSACCMSPRQSQRGPGPRPSLLPVTVTCATRCTKLPDRLASYVRHLHQAVRTGICALGSWQLPALCSRAAAVPRGRYALCACAHASSPKPATHLALQVPQGAPPNTDRHHFPIDPGLAALCSVHCAQQSKRTMRTAITSRACQSAGAVAEKTGTPTAVGAHRCTHHCTCHNADRRANSSAHHCTHRSADAPCGAHRCRHPTLYPWLHHIPSFISWCALLVPAVNSDAPGGIYSAVIRRKS